MPGKRLASSFHKESLCKSNSESRSLSSLKQTIAKKLKKIHAKENKTDISSSEDRTDKRKVLVPKKLNICERVQEGNEKSTAVSTSKGQCELMESGERNCSKKSKNMKLSSGSKEITNIGGYDADISFAPDSSPEAKRKIKKLRAVKNSSDSIPGTGDAPLTWEGEDEPGDTLSDHGDTGSDSDCSDDCEDKCAKNARNRSYGDNLLNGAFDDDDEMDEDELEEDGSEADGLAREMIDNEAVEVDSSDDEDLDESNEGYGMYFESGSTIKERKAPFMDASYNSAKEQEEMETDDDFVVSDTYIEYEEEDDSWLDDDEPETKRKKYSRIVPTLGDDSSSEDDDKVVDQEEASQTGSGSEEDMTAVEQNNRVENGSDPPIVNNDKFTPGKEGSKVGKTGSDGRTLNTSASEVCKARADDGFGQKSGSSAFNKRVRGDTSVMKSASPAPEQARLPLTTVQKLILLTVCSKADLLNLANELIKSERQFFI